MSKINVMVDYIVAFIFGVFRENFDPSVINFRGDAKLIYSILIAFT